jgi:hypothetical protein
MRTRTWVASILNFRVRALLAPSFVALDYTKYIWPAVQEGPTGHSYRPFALLHACMC